MTSHDRLQQSTGTLYEIIEKINASLNETELLNAMLERIVTQLGYRAAALRLLDEEQQQLTLKASFGLSETYLTKGPIAVARSQIDQQVLEGNTVVVPDASRAPGFQYPEAAAREGLASMLAVPLTVRGRVIGVLHAYTGEPHEFSPAEQAFIEAVVDLGAHAVHRTHLYEAFQYIAHSVNSSLELDQVLATLLSNVVRELNVKAGSIRLLGPKRETLHLAAAIGLSKTYLEKGAVKVASSPIDQQVLAGNNPVILSDLTDNAGFQYPTEAQREGIRSVLVLPLRVRETAIGVLRLYSGRVRQFDAEEINFARAVADLGAVAIENAKLHQYVKQQMEELKESADGWYRFLAFS